jgi:hypothetical protein
MATVPVPRITAETNERIQSPLRRLRGTIQRYVVWDSLAWIFILLGAWFWIGMIVDYGGFKITGFDLVQLLPKWFRALVLAGLAVFVVAMLALKLSRLVRQFQPDALALVLERRFPKLLGDKLITAVELSDLDEAEKYGYSRAMIASTVREVSERVDQIPVREVFNWGLLGKRWLLAAAATLGMLLLATAGYLVWYRSTNVVDFGYRFTDVASIWFERNVLLQDTLWPRRAYIEILDFPASGELRIGRDAPSPRIRARALKWVIADRNSADGWRGLKWTDLTPELLDGRAAPTLPADVLFKIASKRSSMMFMVHPEGKADLRVDQFAGRWNLDAMDLVLHDPTMRQELSAQIKPDELTALDGVLETLDQRAGEARMSRTLRKLEIPQTVSIHYWGPKTSNEMPMTRHQDSNEFGCVLSDLKESIKFYIQGEDFSTYPHRKITLVPPPMLTRLEKDEYLPAYQYHRLPADGTALDLKGKKQERLGQGVSLTGGTSRIDIAFGSDLVLRGEVDKDLEQAVIRYRSNQKPAAGAAADTGKTESLPVGDDKRSISRRFDNVTEPIEFDFEFTDTDNVRSLRHIIVQPIDDKMPEVNVAVEIIRKTNQGYMCTPQAMIPFSGSVRDDVGLDRVEYQMSFARVESMQVLAIRAAFAAGIMGTASASPSPRELYSAAWLADYLGRVSESREAVSSLQPLVLKSFQEFLDEKNRDHRYGKAQLADLLRKPNGSDDPARSLDEMRKQRHISQYEIKPNLEWLDLQERVAEFQKGLDDTIRPRFKMRLTIQATDNNIETGPRTRQNNETFTFIVVPYEELLAEMHKDEENLSFKVRDLYDKMVDVRSGIDKVVERMPRADGSDEFRASASRMFDLLSEVEKGSDVARELFSEYSRLLKESQTNRLPAKVIEDTERVVNRLDDAIRNHFERAREAHTIFKDVLESRRVPDPGIVENSRQRQDELINQLKLILDDVGGIVEITRLAQQLGKIIEGSRIIKESLTQLLQDKEDEVGEAIVTLSPKAEPIEMSKGERRVISIDIGRDPNSVSRLLLGFTSPPNSDIAVPKLVIVPRGAKQVQVEIAVGDKTGKFDIPVTFTCPGGYIEKLVDDKPFTLKVTVK